MRLLHSCLWSLHCVWAHGLSHNKNPLGHPFSEWLREKHYILTVSQTMIAPRPCRFLFCTFGFVVSFWVRVLVYSLVWPRVLDPFAQTSQLQNYNRDGLPPGIFLSLFQIKINNDLKNGYMGAHMHMVFTNLSYFILCNLWSFSDIGNIYWVEFFCSYFWPQLIEVRHNQASLQYLWTATSGQFCSGYRCL